MKKEITLTLVGDVMLGRRVSNRIKRHGYRYPFAKTFEVLKNSDIAFVNLESPISKRGEPRPDKRITLTAVPQAINALKYSGIDVVSLANNHILDYGPEAMLDTLKNLRRARIKNAGLLYEYESWQDMPIDKFAIIKRRGVKFGFLAYSSIIPNGFLPNSDLPGIAPMPYLSKELVKIIKTVRSQADVVIFSLHAGKEYLQGDTVDYQEKSAKAAIDAGADIVVGHHPHVLEKIERYKNGLIFYSLGNFVFDQKESEHQGVSKSMMVQVSFLKSKIQSYKIIPVEIKACQPRLLDWDVEHQF